MNPEIKDLWTGALRSGDYTQGAGVLKTTNGEFCCLGVLCELAVQAGVIPPVEKIAESSDQLLGYKYVDQTGVLPNEVMEWAGIDSEGTYELDDAEMVERYPDVQDRSDYCRNTSLIGANDSYGKSFSQIADLIEKHF